jgi:hypothetical protein
MAEKKPTAMARQAGKETCGFSLSHFRRMAFVVEEHEGLILPACRSSVI